MTKCVVVTGSTGLVGTALRARLAETPTSNGRFCVRSPEAALGPDDVVAPDLDTASVDAWRHVLEGADAVAHLAALLPWGASGRDLEQLRRVNVEGSRVLAEAAADAGIRRFVFVSTLGVHGVTCGDEPFTPESPISPSGAYARTKYEAEEILRATLAARNVEFVVIRPPVVYGPGVGGKIGALADRVRQSRVIPLGGLTRNRRQMIGADNLADVIALACSAPEAAGATLLPADAESVSTSEFLHALASAYGKPLRSVPVPNFLFQIARRIPGIGGVAERIVGNVLVADQRLRDRLGWTPPLTLREGLSRMAAGRP